MTDIPPDLLDPCERYSSMTSKAVEPSCVNCARNYTEEVCHTLSERFCTMLNPMGKEAIYMPISAGEGVKDE